MTDHFEEFYEGCRCRNQRLTFHTLEKEFTSRNIVFGPEQMKVLMLTGEDGLYTNLALLLSDQCSHTIKVAVFQGTDNVVFRDRREFSGSLIKQLKDAFTYIQIYNKAKVSCDDPGFEDTRDYPSDALREAMLNSIIHRDYSVGGSTIINVFDDHMEFISLGGLVSGLSMDAVLMGASRSRNPNLAAVFSQLGFIEYYGIGIRKIMWLYHNFKRKPVFRTAEGVFKVEMSNRNENQLNPHIRNDMPSGNLSYYSDPYSAICRLASEKECITRKDVEELLGTGSTKAYKCLKKLCDDGRLVQVLNGNRTVYVLVK